MASKFVNLPAFRFVFNGCNVAGLQYNLTTWKRAIQRTSRPVKVLNFEFGQKYMDFYGVKRATGWDKESRTPLEWNSKGYCFVRGTRERREEHDLNKELVRVIIL